MNKFARGNTRDLRVLWALEEMGVPYEIVGMDHMNHDLDGEEFRTKNPFGQIRHSRSHTSIFASTWRAAWIAPRGSARSTRTLRASSQDERFFLTRDVTPLEIENEQIPVRVVWEHPRDVDEVGNPRKQASAQNRHLSETPATE